MRSGSDGSLRQGQVEVVRHGAQGGVYVLQCHCHGLRVGDFQRQWGSYVRARKLVDALGGALGGWQVTVGQGDAVSLAKTG